MFTLLGRFVIHSPITGHDFTLEKFYNLQDQKYLIIITRSEYAEGFLRVVENTLEEDWSDGYPICDSYAFVSDIFTGKKYVLHCSKYHSLPEETKHQINNQIFNTGFGKVYNETRKMQWFLNHINKTLTVEDDIDNDSYMIETLTLQLQEEKQMREVLQIELGELYDKVQVITQELQQLCKNHSSNSIKSSNVPHITTHNNVCNNLIVIDEDVNININEINNIQELPSKVASDPFETHSKNSQTVHQMHSIQLQKAAEAAFQREANFCNSAYGRRIRKELLKK